MAVTHKKKQDFSLFSFFPSKDSSIGSKQTLTNQGLGKRFFDRLIMNKEKILQVDALSSNIETCGMVLQRSILVAAELKARGIEQNDIIVLCTRTRLEETIVLLATLFIGAILAVLDPQADLNDFEISMVTLNPALVFCDIRSWRQIDLIRKTRDDVQTEVIVFGNREKLFSFEKILNAQSLPGDFVPVSIVNPERSVAFIVASQSTCGQSKLICVSHNALLMQVTTFGNILLQSPEKILSFFPLHWITQLALVCYCLESQTTRIIPGLYSERSACRIIHDLEVDVAVLGTEYAYRIAEDVSSDDYDLSCLKTVFVGGIPTPASIMVHLRKHFANAKVLQCYGLSEMSGFVSGFSAADYEAAVVRPGSVGKVLPGIKFKILNLDTKTPLGPDWWGELVVTGLNLMLGYYKNKSATIDAMHKHYFKTGDVAQYDSDGYLYVQGRASDYITVGGKRVSPYDLEEILVGHKHVIEAVLIGNGKETVACVVKKPEFKLSEEGLMRYLSDRLPEEKLPSKIRFFDRLPKTTVGKVKRNLLKRLIFGVIIERMESFESKST